jgi:hypothetical protein
VRTEGQWQELRSLPNENWTSNEKIKPVGYDNELVVTVLLNQITGYVNATQVVQVKDSTLKPGGLGIYFATPDESDASATVLADSYGTYASVPSMTGS